MVINHNKPENKETWVVVKFAFKKTTKRKTVNRNVQTKLVATTNKLCRTMLSLEFTGGSLVLFLILFQLRLYCIATKQKGFTLFMFLGLCSTNLTTISY
jgi:hypothetical protein